VQLANTTNGSNSGSNSNTTTNRFYSSTSSIKSNDQYQNQSPLFTDDDHNFQQQLRAYPQYSVFGEQCILGIKVMLPLFKVLRNQTLVIDNSKRGRLLFEWLARTPDGRIDRGSSSSNTTTTTPRFALSAEECGLLLHQLELKQAVEFVRPAQSHSLQNTASFTNDLSQNFDKVMYATPGKGGMTSFKIDYEADGVSSSELQSQPNDKEEAYDNDDTTIITTAAASQQGATAPPPIAPAPMEVVVQTGELQVILSIIRTSLPHLVGWSTTMDIAMKQAITESMRHAGGGGGGGGRGGSGRGGGGFYN